MSNDGISIKIELHADNVVGAIGNSPKKINMSFFMRLGMTNCRRNTHG